MATKKGKGGDKKASRKNEEEVIRVDERTDDAVRVPEDTPTVAAEEILSVEVPATSPEPEPEPVYEEPILTQLIIESYDGEKEKGLFHGDGAAWFIGGHHYEGQFCEGLMHGYGTYTWTDGVVYEGDFLHNAVTGKGKYTWTDGSVYEGEVLNGLRHGFGVLHSASHDMTYSGEWSHGMQNGKGRLNYDPQGLSYYDGQWVNNIRHGYGVRQYPSGNIYEGMWYNNVRHGLGTMQWFDQNQSYTGNWENGVQHGMGQQVWYLRRGATTQYPLRNTYDGELVRGMRHGFGVFHYANGACYEGEWKYNVKCGKGKFVFKNGRVYEGIFENDHIVEFPAFEMDGLTTPDVAAIRTRTPLPSEHMSVRGNESVNTFSPSFRLDVVHLLQHLDECDREDEISQVSYVMLRHMTSLHRVYAFYSRLGREVNPDNAYVMTQMQFWRLLKDCEMHYEDYGLTDMDRWLARTADRFPQFHDPHQEILFREFLDYLVVLAYHLYRDHLEGSGPVLAKCLSKLISENILKHACQVKGSLYCEPGKTVNALVHLEETFSVYTALCTPRKRQPADSVLTIRQFLLALKDMNLIDQNLTVKIFIDILSSDDPKISDECGSVNLEYEMCFLEFFEVLIGCAQYYVTEANVVNPDLTQTQTQSQPEKINSQQLSLQSVPHVLISQATVDTAGLPPLMSPKISASVVSADLFQSLSDTSRFLTESDRELLNLLSDEALHNDAAVAAAAAAATATDVDDSARQFNFWTHQVHFFFVRKFLPAARLLLTIKEQLKLEAEREVANAALRLAGC